jgi:hypothetical protein
MEVDAETLEIFCSSTEADEETGRRLLAKAGGDLDTAIDDYFDSLEATPRNEDDTPRDTGISEAPGPEPGLEPEPEPELVGGLSEVERELAGDESGSGSGDGGGVMAVAEMFSGGGVVPGTGNIVHPPASTGTEGTAAGTRIRSSSVSTLEVEQGGKLYSVDKESLLVFELPDYVEVGEWDDASQAIVFGAVAAEIGTPPSQVPARTAGTSGGTHQISSELDDAGYTGEVREDTSAEQIPTGTGAEDAIDAETLEIFCSSTEADEETGRRLLAKAGGDLDTAIDDYFDSLEATPRDEEMTGMSAVAEGEATVVGDTDETDVVEAEMVVAKFTEQARLGVNFGDFGRSWPSVASITPDSLAYFYRPKLEPGLILHAVEGVAGRQVVEHMSFQDGMQVVMAAHPSNTGQPITVTFKRGLLMGGGEVSGREFSEARRQRQLAQLPREMEQQQLAGRARSRAAFPRGVSQLLVLGPSGSLLAARDYRGDMAASAAELAQRFRSGLLVGGAHALNTPPVFMSKQGDCFMHIRRPMAPSGLRFVFVTRCNCFPSLCIELLLQLAGLVESYCGELSEEAVRSNLNLVNELVSEAVDCGLPQETRGPALLDHVFELSRKPLHSTTAGRFATQASPRATLSVAQGQNEVFIDVVEQVSATFQLIPEAEQAAAQLIHSELNGTVWMRSYLRGRSSEVRIVFNRELLIGEQAGQLASLPDEEQDGEVESGVEVADAVFYDTVQCDSNRGPPDADLSSVRVVKVKPPVAERIAVMRYRVSVDNPSLCVQDSIRIPFELATAVTQVEAIPDTKSDSGALGPPAVEEPPQFFANMTPTQQSEMLAALAAAADRYGTYHHEQAKKQLIAQSGLGQQQMDELIGYVRSSAVSREAGEQQKSLSSFGSRGHIVLSVQLRAAFPASHEADDVRLRVLLPKEVASCSVSCGPDLESACVRAAEESEPEPETGATQEKGGMGWQQSAAYWRLRRVRGESCRTLQLRLWPTSPAQLSALAKMASGTSSMVLHFGVPMLQCSRVAIKNIRVYDGGKSNEDAHRWLRYHLQSGSWRVNSSKANFDGDGVGNQ